MYNSRSRRTNPMVIILLLQLWQQLSRMEYKPPITVGLLVANIGVFLAPELLPYRSIRDVCLLPAAILNGMDLKRLVLSGFYHANEMHLYYNMGSLLWKGAQLETSMGSASFGIMTAFVLLVSHGLVVLSSLIMATTMDFNGPYHQCAVGFSAVLFAWKVVLNTGSPRNSYIYGLEVPTKYAAWVELVMISILVPQASFMGHLCGILAGCIYLYVRPYLDSFARAITEASEHHQQQFRRTYNDNYPPQTNTYRPQYQDPPSYTNRPSYQHFSQPYSMSPDEIRRARLNRFQ